MWRQCQRWHMEQKLRRLKPAGCFDSTQGVPGSTNRALCFGLFLVCPSLVEADAWIGIEEHWFKCGENGLTITGYLLDDPVMHVIKLDDFEEGVLDSVGCFGLEPHT